MRASWSCHSVTSRSPSKDAVLPTSAAPHLAPSCGDVRGLAGRATAPRGGCCSALYALKKSRIVRREPTPASCALRAPRMRTGSTSAGTLGLSFAGPAARRRVRRDTTTHRSSSAAFFLPNPTGIRWHWRGGSGTRTIAEFACAAAGSGGEPCPVAGLRKFTQRLSSPAHPASQPRNSSELRGFHLLGPNLHCPVHPRDTTRRQQAGFSSHRQAAPVHLP
jgi:hypothetical protein